MNVNHGITDTGKLKTIEIDKYEPIPDKPGYCRAVGQASKQEIFDQLKDHLEYVGMLPDEYFIISTQQPEIIPENWRDFTCNVSYGGSEGIYLDKSLAEKYAVSYSPIKTAYQSLEREGYIHLSTKGSIVIEQPKTVKENIASKLDEILQTALDFGAAKEDIVEAIDFIMENYC